MFDLDFMNEFAPAFERRWRDTKSRNRCLSIESRYVGDEVCTGGTEQGDSSPKYGEDALVLALHAWGEVPSEMQQAVRVSFGFGARSQAEYEERLQTAFRRCGAGNVHAATDGALKFWYGKIRERAGEDFDLLFEKL